MAPGTVEAQQSERQQGKLLHRDPLTGLPNRFLFDDRLEQAIRHYPRRRQPFAVVSIELDGFKKINDRHGRVVGDQVLSSLTAGMQRVLRRGDLLARLCGQHFAAILLDATNVQDSVPVITRLLDAATEPVQAAEGVVYATASIGVAFYPQDAVIDAGALLDQAVAAMRQAKRAGRNLYHFSEASSFTAKTPLGERIEQVRRALQAREFALFFQPTVSLSHGRVVGVEALIRWRHPERGLLTPGEFLPAIEEDHLAIEVGEWVIESALMQMEEWREKSVLLPVSVNIGAHHFSQPDFAERLRGLLNRFPEALRATLGLEIHGAASADAARLEPTVKACRAMGLTVALDDFGSSRSSLSDLKLLSANAVKIDALFVRDLLDHPEDVAMMEGILGIADAFQRPCVAKGVESLEQGLLLLRLGCEYVQGYATGCPMEANDLPAWIAEWRPDPLWAEVNTSGVEERLIAYTSVEHHAWIAHLQAWLEGQRECAPRLSRHQCQLGVFIDGEEQAGRNYRPAFQALAALHWRMHAVGSGIVKLHAQGKTAEALSRLGELPALLEKQLEQLADFRVKVPPALAKIVVS
jgi:diguanylate cyclase (GGDEF)-like protein